MSRRTIDDRSRRIAFLTFLLLAALAAPSRADRIMLRGGSQIRGVVLPQAAGSDRVEVQTEALTTPIRYRKDQVLGVVPEATPLHEYLDRRAAVGPDAQSQFDLGTWADDHDLHEFAKLHDERAVGADPGFGPAQRRLGHVLYDGRWITADELREAQGLVKFRGRWISREEKAGIDAEADARIDRAGWARRIQVLRQAILQGQPDRRAEAEDQLMATRDPAAIGPLIWAFGKDPEPLRELLAAVIGAIPGPEATAGLVGRVLAEAEPGPRGAALNELVARDDPEAISQLVRALKHNDSRVVNRAAWALAQLDAVEVVPKLVPALGHVERRIVWEQASSTTGGETGAFFGSGVTVPIAVLDSVAVGPGSVGYGASALPFTSGVGIGTPTVAPGMTGGQRPRLATYTYQNIEVLNALRVLTKQDFGFDQAAWRKWLVTGFRPEQAPVRRVFQP